MPEEFRFDIAFSFAGAHRDKVRAIAEIVAAKLGLERVFYDDWYKHEILGDDMDVLLQSFYHEESLMVVADLSEEYAGRPWCRAEARAIRALRFELDPARDQTGRLRLLNARFGDGEVPGVFKTTAYLDGIGETTEQCADLILKRHSLLVQRLGSTRKVAPILVTVEFVSEGPIHTFDPESLKRGFDDALGIKSSKIRIVSVRSGSTIVTVETI